MLPWDSTSVKITVLQNQIRIGFQRGFPRQGNSYCIHTWLQSSCSSPEAPPISLWAVINIGIAELPFQAMPQGRPNFTLTQTDAFASNQTYYNCRSTQMSCQGKQFTAGLFLHSNCPFAGSYPAAPKIELAIFCRGIMTWGEVLGGNAAQRDNWESQIPSLCLISFEGQSINEVLT